MSCLNCNKKTSNPKFCSRSCAASYNNKKHPKRTIEKKCKHCDNKVRNWRSTLCEDCYQERRVDYKNKTIGEYRNRPSVKGKHPSWLHSHVRNFARSWLKHLTKQPCVNCGYDKHVELCHIKPVSSFSDDTLLGEVNSPRNVVPLCRNCHWEFDHKLLDLAFPEFDHLHL